MKFKVGDKVVVGNTSSCTVQDIEDGLLWCTEDREHAPRFLCEMRHARLLAAIETIADIELEAVKKESGQWKRDFESAVSIITYLSEEEDKLLAKIVRFEQFTENVRNYIYTKNLLALNYIETFLKDTETCKHAWHYSDQSYKLPDIKSCTKCGKVDK